MIKRNIVIVPFSLPWDWSADYQWQTCLVLAKTYLVIVYVHNDARFFSKSRPDQKFPRLKNIIFFQPRYPIPFRRLTIIEKLNQIINLTYLSWRYGRGRRVLLWIFDPVFWFYPKIRLLYPWVISFYDCVDYVWHKERGLRGLLQFAEQTLIRSVDYFFVNSHILARLHLHIRKPTAIVPQGFRLSEFQRPLPAHTTFPNDKPIIGFVGALDVRIDFCLLTALIRRNPQWLFVIWGQIQVVSELERLYVQGQMQTIMRRHNVIVGSSKDRREIPSIIKQFDVGIIPYDMRLPVVKYSYPMKLFEYFYMKKPVISTPIEELKRFLRCVRIGFSVKEWEDHIEKILSNLWTIQYKNEQKNMAKINSWENKIHEIMRAIELDECAQKTNQ